MAAYELTKDATVVPDVYGAPGNTLTSGQICIVGQETAGGFTARLPEGKHVVLTAAGGACELTTTSAVPTGVNQPGTYLAAVDLATLGSPANPTLRLYKLGDTWHKITSRGGRELLAAFLVAIATFAVGAVWTLQGDSTTTAKQVAERTQTMLQYVAAPAEDLDPGSDNASVRREISRRQTAVQQCVAELRGDDTPKATIPDVVCKPDDPPTGLSEKHKDYLTTLLGLATLILTGVGLNKSFGFGKQPT
jgi:hypothetical protein